MKEKILELIQKIYQIFKNETFNEQQADFKKIIGNYQAITSIDFESILVKTNVKFEKINQLNQIESKNVYLCMLKNNNNEQWSFFYRKKSKIILNYNKGKIIEITQKEFSQMKILAIWKLDGVKDINTKILDDINTLKIKYAFAFGFLELILIGLIIFGNFYLKIILDHVMPNGDVNLLIKTSVLFLAIFLVSLLIEQIIFFTKKSIINEYTKKYYMQLMEYINWMGHYENQKINFGEFQNYVSSIGMMLSHHIFFIPGIIASSVNVVVITFVIGTINPYFIFIELFLLFGIFIFNFFKLKINSIMMVNQIHTKNYLEKLINQFYFFTIEEKNDNIYQLYKSKIARNIKSYENTDISFSLKIKKVEIFESFFKKIIIVIFTLIFVFMIITSNTTLVISTLIYAVTLMTTLTSSAEEIFDVFIKIPQYKFFDPYFKKIINHHIIKEINKIKLKEKINKIEFKNSKIIANKYQILNNLSLIIKNDTLIYGKSGIGKTSIVKAILYGSKSSNIFINNINKNQLCQKWLRKKIIYYNSKFSEDILSIENILYDNKFQTKKIIELVKKYHINLSDLSKLSSGQKQFIKFLTLLNYQNKIIILDEPLSNVDSSFKIEIINSFKDELISNNFVIWISHDKTINNFFKNQHEVL